MRIKLLILTVFAIGVCVSADWAQSPVLDKMSLNISLRTFRGQPEWRWVPVAKFDVIGRLSESAKVRLEYTLPTGQAFVKLECPLEGIPEDEYQTASDCGNDLERELATNLTGAFGFKIHLIDEPSGINTALYSGKFTTNKFLFNPAKNPAFNKNFYYFVEYDWRLTTAYVGTLKNEYTPWQLFSWVWIKGDQTSPEATAQLMFKGQKVAETSFGADMSYGVEENDAAEFTRLKFRFNAIAEKPESPSYEEWWKLYENPGEYEIRVLRKGVLARSFKFTIGPGGKLVDSGIAKELKEGYNGVMAPVKIEGNSDGTINPTLLKAGWWGNPISNLLVP